MCTESRACNWLVGRFEFIRINLTVFVKDFFGSRVIYYCILAKLHDIFINFNKCMSCSHVLFMVKIYSYPFCSFGMKE